MTAQPADIAALLNDGVALLTDQTAGAAIKKLNADALPTDDPTEIEMFFTDPAVGQAMLDEKWSYLQRVNQPHIGLALEDSAGVGETIPLSPAVPCGRLIDRSIDLDATARLRSYAQDMDTDRYSLEFLG